ncbi:DNA cytosine methyltransferase [Peptostreptococcaceae bacterium OttesenSCG-928-C18]|nr:DNA cytosine methyltransferase [Peptostreptococcaceae bacterium OttesenSCG-928-C18]
MNKQLTLGSLFDGSGGFPLGAILNGIKPLWASEIEPFPIRVTTKRLPEVKHLGDISTVNGAEIAPVDIITFGSPCTNLSVAGKREGLEGEQSSLFFEAIRIIKEMRCATNGKYPRWICWENVPGAYSSNQGKDFRQVLTEIAKIKDETHDIPMPEKDKWSTAGEIVGDSFSIAWRTVDAQFWGVAQRRRRCYLIADFADECAGKVLFEFERLSGYTPQGFGTRKGTTGGSADCTGTTSCTVLNDQGGSRMDVTDDVTCTLRAEAHHPPCVVEASGFCTEHSAQSRGVGFEKEKSPTLRAGVVPAAVAMFENHSQDTRYTGPVEVAPTVSATYGMGGNNQPFVVNENNVPLTLKIRSGCEGGGKGALIQENQSATLSTVNDQSLFVPFRKGTHPHSKDEGQKWEQAETANTLNTFDTGENRCNELAVKAYGICSQASNAMQSDNPHSGIYEADTARTLDAGGGNPTCNQGGIAVCVQGSMIGREEKNGPQGSGINENTAFTLNTVDRHAVVYAIDRESYNCGQNFARNLGITEDGVNSTLKASGPDAVAHSTYCASKASFFTSAEEELANTLVATDYKDPPLINDKGAMEYLVRRLTPTECALLQGFPPDWCADLGTPEPTEEDIAFWTEVFDTYAKINGKKPRSKNQIIKWLKEPHTDSAEYKMWGNGVALPCVCFVMAGIVYCTQDSH